MPKISLVNKTGKIGRISLRSEVTCPVDDCGYEQGCAGRNSRRDTDFICDLSELIELYKKDGGAK